MTKKQQPQTIRLEQLAAESLSKQLHNSIDQVELQIQSLPKFCLMVTQGSLFVSVNAKVPIKKTLLWLGGVSSVLFGAIKLIVTNWPYIQSVFQ